MEVFRFAPSLISAIIDHARTGFPEEVCGLIAGHKRLGLELYQARNVAREPRTHFEVDLDTLARQIEFSDRGLDLAAIYHSHPQGPEVPSETDRDAAFYPEAVYIICSLSESEPVLRGFRIVGSQVWEVSLRE
jgi:[CysO sulfur-carrier protein]-S-L-cysteine hydrolase